jgi:hypothetical protein
MSRYHLHLREFRGDLIEDNEGSDLSGLTAAREHAVMAMKELLGEAIKHGEEFTVEALIVADEHGSHVASVPIVAALPAGIVNALKFAAKVLPQNKFNEYRSNADACRAMAENAANPDDKAGWLNLADAWLHMLPQHEPATSPDLPGWPKASDEDSKASH